MKKQRILISGDSFAAYHAIDEYQHSWTQLPQSQYNVTNVAQSGVSEYKILKQLESVKLENFDFVIVVHTSANRVHINQHPVHHSSASHFNCDLIYNDIADTKHKNIVLETANNYFKYIFDETYYKDIHRLLVKEILQTTACVPCLHLSFFSNLHPAVVDVSRIWNCYPGNVHHLDYTGNLIIKDQVIAWLNQHC